MRLSKLRRDAPGNEGEAVWPNALRARSRSAATILAALGVAALWPIASDGKEDGGSTRIHAEDNAPAWEVSGLDGPGSGIRPAPVVDGPEPTTRDEDDAAAREHRRNTIRRVWRSTRGSRGARTAHSRSTSAKRPRSSRPASL